MDDRKATQIAFDMARQHGFIEAKRLAAQARDNNAPGTMSFALHNQVCRKLAEFAAAGTMYRPL